MKNLAESIKIYTELIEKGDIQTAYRGIMDFFGYLRVSFTKTYPQYEIGNLYQGYMDMTYFSITTDRFKAKGLKVAIVYLHAQGVFEVWLSARNRSMAKTFVPLFSSDVMLKLNAFHDMENPDAIVERKIVEYPDFDSQDDLAKLILQETERFVTEIGDHILN